MTKILVLGATGMLGSAVLSLAAQRGHDVTGTTTSLTHAPASLRPSLVEFDARRSDLNALAASLDENSFVINCIGLIKHNIDASSVRSRESAIGANSLLPHRLAEVAYSRGFRVIQIATDCVYSGRQGNYEESASHDADDVYGQTKSLGEVPSPYFLHLRCSIIGRELKTHRSLLDWVLEQPRGAEIVGFLDHHWNGVTTVAFGRVALGLIAGGLWRPGTFHLTPRDTVSKSELVELILAEFGRSDIRLSPRRTGAAVDRTLRCADPSWNEQLWFAAGYESVPDVAMLVRELAALQGVSSWR